MQPTIKWTDFINWSRLSTVGGSLVSIVMFIAAHMSHTAIVTKVAADSTANWSMTYVELAIAVLSSLLSMLTAWKQSQGQTAYAKMCASNTSPETASAEATPDETVAVLLQKIEHRCRLDAAAKIMGEEGKQ